MREKCLWGALAMSLWALGCGDGGDLTDGGVDLAQEDMRGMMDILEVRPDLPEPQEDVAKVDVPVPKPDIPGPSEDLGPDGPFLIQDVPATQEDTRLIRDVPLTPPDARPPQDVPLTPPDARPPQDVPLMPPDARPPQDVPLTPPDAWPPQDVPLTPPDARPPQDIPLMPPDARPPQDVPLTPPDARPPQDVPLAQQDRPAPPRDILLPPDCLTNGDCPHGQVCNAASLTCQIRPIQCLGSGDCPANGWTCEQGYCDYTAWECSDPRTCDLVAPCETNDDCPGGTDLYFGWGGICHPESHSCVGCLDDTDCSGSMHCRSVDFEELMYQCMEPPSDQPYAPCLEDDDCLGSRTCYNGHCQDPPCEDDRLEDNDSGIAAVPLSPAYYEGLMLCTDDGDWFTIDIPADHALRIDATFDQDLVDLDLYLCESVSSCNTMGAYLMASELNPDHEWIFREAQGEDQRYWLLIRAYGAGEFPATGPYNLLVQIFQPQCMSDDQCPGELNLCQPDNTCLMVECLDSTDCEGFLCRNHVCTDIGVPENDTCAGAIDVSAGGAFEGVIDAAGPDYSGSCGGNGPDVVYSFTLDAETLVQLDTNGSGYDTVLYVRSGECEGDREVGCDDDNGEGTASLLTLTLPAGPYYIFVDAYSASATGSSILNVTLGE